MYRQFLVLLLMYNMFTSLTTQLFQRKQNVERNLTALVVPLILGDELQRTKNILKKKKGQAYTDYEIKYYH